MHPLSTLIKIRVIICAFTQLPFVVVGRAHGPYGIQIVISLADLNMDSW